MPTHAWHQSDFRFLEHKRENVLQSTRRVVITAIRQIISSWMRILNDVDLASTQGKALATLEETVRRYPGVKRIVLNPSTERSDAIAPPDVSVRIIVSAEYDRRTDLLLRGHIARVNARFRTTIRYTISGR